MGDEVIRDVIVSPIDCVVAEDVVSIILIGIRRCCTVQPQHNGRVVRAKEGEVGFPDIASWNTWDEATDSAMWEAPSVLSRTVTRSRELWARAKPVSAVRAANPLNTMAREDWTTQRQIGG